MLQVRGRWSEGRIETGREGWRKKGAQGSFTRSPDAMFPISAEKRWIEFNTAAREK